jgi:nanoRNase/pAp phosphatase (c-di-AMP/oligoRNAs hydrolase)
LIPEKKIAQSKHILIKSDKENFPQASILYSYLLSQHKKVSWYAQEKERRFSFLPWYEKIRQQKPTSVDLEIDASVEIMELYTFVNESDVKINQKMATAFYAGFLKRYANFLSSECNGTVFAVLSALIDLGAEQQLCVREMLQKVPLSLIRLKSLLYKKLQLVENATVVEVKLRDEDFAQSGASWEDMVEAGQELLNIVHVHELRVIKIDEKDKILKIVKDV